MFPFGTPVVSACWWGWVRVRGRGAGREAGSVLQTTVAHRLSLLCKFIPELFKSKMFNVSFQFLCLSFFWKDPTSVAGTKLGQSARG